MFLDYLLAPLLMLMSPPEAIDVTPQVTLMYYRPAYVQMLLAWELLDWREVRFMFNNDMYTYDDIKLIHRRWKELGDAPPVRDSLRFPSRDEINDLLAFNRAFRVNLDIYRVTYLRHNDAINQVIRENDQLYRTWDTLRDAKCEYYYDSVRRMALKRLKDELGPDAYYSARMPPHVPVWRFRPIE